MKIQIMQSEFFGTDNSLLLLNTADIDQYFIKKKRYFNKMRLIIFNLKLLPFLKYDIAIEFYKKIKDVFETI